MHRKPNNHSPALFLGAFGKHPGWDDHIDDLGLETDTLVAIKRAIYTDGVGINVDSGAWEALEERRRTEGFDHLVVWRNGSDMVVGRLWSSSDGKGRTRYPMVAAAHATGTALDWAVGEALPRLEVLRARCVATKSAREVRDTVDQTRRQLRDALAAAGKGAFESPNRINPIERLAGHANMGSQGEGLLRILYQVEREMSAFKPLAPGTTAFRVKGASQRAQQIRVPKCGQGPADEALLWQAFMLTQVHAAAPVLVLVPVDQTWVDVIVGESGAAQLFCLRATQDAIPLVTEIPFTLEPGFIERAGEFIAQARAGEGVSFSVSPAMGSVHREPKLLQRILRLRS
ncbi:MAG: hypothetical protein L0219_14290 [Phycisphaerales bacterium]|nr:hypothetical protein [Phycisphaerales bacterium]